MGRLDGMRILVTRPRERASSLCFLLEDEGAQVTALPLLELQPPRDPRPLQAAAEQLQRYAWIAFASPAAVEALDDAARVAGTQARLRDVRLAAVGPGTARALEALGLTVQLRAEPSTGLGLATSLLPLLQAEDTVLLPVAESGRREGIEALREANVQVVEVIAYRTEGAAVSTEVWRSLEAEPPQAVLFGSPRTVGAFLEAGPGARALLTQSQVVAIGPTTEAALRAEGLHGIVRAAQPTDESLLDATVRALCG